MEKTPRYTQRERNMVLSYAAQYKDVIENKRTDAESNRKKDEVWLQIAKDFNSRVYHQRSAKQLRQLYKNMKLLLKKDLCGEDKSNHSFMDLLNTLSQQESVAQYIAEQLSPEGAGGGGKQGGPGHGGIQGNGHHGDDYDDSKVGLYVEGMDTDVIVIKSETISDNEQTDNGMDCLDDDDDDDCLSPKAPEVCLEEEDDVLFPTDLRQLQQQVASNPGGVNSSSASSSLLPGNSNNNNNGALTDPLRRAAASSPVCSTKTSVSSSGSYVSTPKPDITIQTVGHIRVGSFANINKTLQNGSGTGSGAGISPSNGIAGSSNGTVLPLTAEQVQQHTLLNGLGLSAVNPPPQSLQAAINAATAFVSATSSSVAATGNRRTPPTLQLPRLQRGNNNNNNNNNSATAGNGNTNSSSSGLHTNGGVQLLLNGNHHQQQQQSQSHHHPHHPHLSRDKTGGGVAIGAAGSFNGYNGLAVAVPCGNLNTSSGAGSGSSSANSSGVGLGLGVGNNAAGSGAADGSSSNSGGGGGRGVKRPHQELMDSLKIEEAQRKIDLLNAQTDYWLTLTRKINSQEGGGHFPNPACPCHFPGASFLSPAVVQAAAAAAAAAAGSTSSSSSSS
ncbi:hypothetical protein KR054_010341, partial [Drosophila jambulina]